MARKGRRALKEFHIAREVFGDKPIDQLENPERPSAAYYLLGALRKKPGDIPREEDSRDAAEH